MSLLEPDWTDAPFVSGVPKVHVADALKAEPPALKSYNVWFPTLWFLFEKV